MPTITFLHKPDANTCSGDTGNYRSRVLSVQQTGDAAVAVVAEEGYWVTATTPTCRYQCTNTEEVAAKHPAYV